MPPSLFIMLVTDLNMKLDCASTVWNDSSTAIKSHVSNQINPCSMLFFNAAYKLYVYPYRILKVFKFHFYSFPLKLSIFLDQPTFSIQKISKANVQYLLLSKVISFHAAET